MFNKDFKNKKIVFLGDSIMADGRYMHNMRAYMHDKEDRCYILNSGIGGNRADMAFDLLDVEVFADKPDYCLVCFGANDIGGWLYGANVVVDEKNLEERKTRNNNYFNGIDHICTRCKENGVTPILMSPYATNQRIIEKDNIQTLGDNKEKAEKLGSSFYKQESLKNVNGALRLYRDFLKKYAEEHEGVIFLDMFEKSFEVMMNDTDLFNDDGVHYSEKGHKHLAKIILELFGYENVSLEFIHGEGAEDVWNAEKLDRNGKFVRYNQFNAVNGPSTIQDHIDWCNKTLANEKEPMWLKNSCKAYLENYNKFEENRKKYHDIVLRY
jgi:lysophospholipase L1-like esterase